MIVAHRPSASAATSRREHVRAPVPPNLFGIPFGLAGLAGTWLAMAGTGRAAELIGDGLLVVTAFAWSTVLGVYMSRP